MLPFFKTRATLRENPTGPTAIALPGRCGFTKQDYSGGSCRSCSAAFGFIATVQRAWVDASEQSAAAASAGISAARSFV